ncbi:MAG: glutamine synthetase family protein [Sedimentitalea sp.]
MQKGAFGLPEGTETVVLGVGDLNGIMRGKRIPASHWDTTCEDGNALSIALFALDMTCDVWDTPYVNFGNGYPDFHMFPATKPVPIPWEPGVAVCMGVALGKDHQPLPIDPRQALIRQLDRAKAMGLTINVGAELEFYLLDPETGLPKEQSIQVYGLVRAARMEHVVGPIRQQINACGIPIEQSNPEYAPGQVEVNIRYGEALEAADRVVLFRSLVKQLALHEGYDATFMPKPFIDQSGSGFHCHYSVWKDGVNVFAEDGKLNEMGHHFLGGMKKRMAETAVCGGMTENGYRRRRPYTFCPINTCWGYDNRTVGLRVLEGKDSAVRVEKRDAGADANPYLLMATDIAAGLDGIEQKIDPGAPTMGDAYTVEDAEPIPTDLTTAIAAARGSDWLKSILGETQYELMLQQCERELEFVREQVTQVEIDRYKKNF